MLGVEYRVRQQKWVFRCLKMPFKHLSNLLVLSRGSNQQVKVVSYYLGDPLVHRWTACFRAFCRAPALIGSIRCTSNFLNFHRNSRCFKKKGTRPRRGVTGMASQVAVHLAVLFPTLFRLVGCHQIQILVVCETVQSPCHNPKLSVSSTPSLW